jgi:undecaprenyl-diphosphatase
MNLAIFSPDGSFLSTFLASFLIWIMYIGLFVYYLIDGKIKKEQVIHCVFVSLVAWIVAHMIKDILPATRPFRINGSPPLTVTVHSTDSSFPSGHAAAAFALAVSLFLHDKKIGTVYILAAILVSLGRVITNVHYPIDVVAGAILGMFTALAMEKVHLGRFVRR